MTVAEQWEWFKQIAQDVLGANLSVNCNAESIKERVYLGHNHVAHDTAERRVFHKSTLTHRNEWLDDDMTVWLSALKGDLPR